MQSTLTLTGSSMNVEIWPLDRPVPYARNPRVNAGAVDKVAASLAEFGWKQPVVVDAQGIVIVGHTRLLAAKKLGLSECPVVVASDLTPTQCKAYRLADNRTNEEASWDNPLLALELEDLKLDAFDLGLMGFDADELAALDGSGDSVAAGQTQDDAVPELPAQPLSVVGDLWLLGKHRVLCGDATNKEHLARLMRGEKEHAIVTDPPYGVGVEYGSFEDSPENVRALVAKIMPRVLQAPCAVLTPGVPCMWSYPQPRWVMVWVHPAPTGGCPWGFAGVNPILAYGKDPYLAAGLGRRPDSLVSASDRQGVEGHPTPKPMKIWAWLVERVTPHAGETVLDLFAGSGTTLIACEKLDRKARLMELGPAYCDVIVKRWQDFTGNKAVHEDGTRFDDRVTQPAAARPIPDV
jgi:hypothetical protein